MNQMNAALGAITATNEATNNVVHTLLTTVVSLHDKVSAIEARQNINSNNNIPIAAKSGNNWGSRFDNKDSSTSITSLQSDAGSKENVGPKNTEKHIQ